MTQKKTTKKPPNSSTKSKPHHRAKQKIQHHYFRVMPNQRWQRSTIWSLFWIAAGIILLQLIYPPDRVLPTGTLLGQPRVWTSEAELVAEIQRLFDKTRVELVAGDKSIVVPLKNFGAAPESSNISHVVTDYPFWQRYVPLSILLRQPNIDQVTPEYTNIVSQAACKDYAQQLSTEPVNARIAIEDNRLVADEDRPGRQVDPALLCRVIQETDLELAVTTSIEAPAKLVEPATTASDLSAVKTLAEAALASQSQFMYQDQIYQPDRRMVASWLQIAGSADRPQLSLDRTAVRSYLQNINKSIGRAAGKTMVTVVDGVEVNRSEGQVGRQIDYQAATDRITGQLLGASTAEPIVLSLVDVKPSITYNNRYTNTEAGLQAYVADAARRYNAHISIRQLNGESWRAAARQHDSIPSASTYKLYVAQWLFDEMAAGRTNWQAPILGTTVSDCFDQMTIASTNACSRQWLSQAGRDNMNNYVYAQGFSRGTTFTHPLATHTTAEDLTNYMTRLAQGSLMPDIYRQRLYNSLGNHPYGYGIPAGSAGKVYDKVGFLWDYTHDTAIVEHPRGRYVMTIMTKGQSYGRIAIITREVERIMYGN